MNTTSRLNIHIFLFLLGKYLGMQLLGCMVNWYLTYQEAANYFPEWLHHFTFSSSIYEESNFPTSLPVFFILVYFLSTILVGVKCYFMVWIYIFLMTNDVEHTVMFLLVIPVSSLMKHFFKYFDILRICLYSLFIVLLNYKGFYNLIEL